MFASMSADSITESVLTPLTRSLTPDAARETLAFALDEQTKSRVALLAAKCLDDQLSEDERAEYASLVEACDLVALLKSKARQVLEATR
jgi:hypothetical protein